MGTNIKIVRGHDAKDYFKKEGEVLTNGLTYWYIHVRGKGLVRDAKQRVMRFTTKKMAKAYCANEKNLIFKNKKLDVIMVKTLKNEKHSLRVASVGSQKVYCACDVCRIFGYEAKDVDKSVIEEIIGSDNQFTLKVNEKDALFTNRLGVIHLHDYIGAGDSQWEEFDELLKATPIDIEPEQPAQPAQVQPEPDDLFGGVADEPEKAEEKSGKPYEPSERELEDRKIFEAFQILQRRVEEMNRKYEEASRAREPKTYTFDQMADELKLKNKGYLMQLLVDDKIVYKCSGYWRTFAKYKDSPYFAIRKSTKMYKGKEKEVGHLVLTESGRQWLLENYQNRTLSIYRQS